MDSEVFMRFILNFIFFGILFYLIHLFFPEAFNTLVGWCDKIYIFFKDLFMSLYERFYQNQGTTSAPPATPPAAPTHALFIVVPYLWHKYIR